MKKKMLLVLLILVGLLTITGCGKDSSGEKKESDKKESSSVITISSDEKDFVTKFKSTNEDGFVQKDPKYTQIHSEKLGVFISFDYIESPKETYDYYKTHNLFGNEYAEGDVTDYTWGKYSGYTYNVQDKEMYFRILLVDDPENSVVLSGYVGDKHTNDDLDMSKTFNSKEFQDFLNTIDFKNDSK